MIVYDDGAIRSIEDAASAAGLKCRRITATRAPYLGLEGDWKRFLAGKSGHFRRILKQKEDRVSRGPGMFEVERVRTGLGPQPLDALHTIDNGELARDGAGGDARRTP